MNKKDLKSGMLVQTREGAIYMIIGDSLVRKTGYLSLTFINDDLTSKSTRDFDIIKVTHKLTHAYKSPKKWTQETVDAYLNWEVKELFKQGDIVISNAGNIVIVTEDQFKQYIFEGTCIKSVASLYSNGHHSRTWQRKEFTITNLIWTKF